MVALFLLFVIFSYPSLSSASVPHNSAPPAPVLLTSSRACRARNAGSPSVISISYGVVLSASRSYTDICVTAFTGTVDLLVMFTEANGRRSRDLLLRQAAQLQLVFTFDSLLEHLTVLTPGAVVVVNDAREDIPHEYLSDIGH